MRAIATAALALIWTAAAGASSVPADPGGFLRSDAPARFAPLGSDAPSLLAQRSIEREWTARGDTTPRPGARSDLGAMALSAAVPGAGQLYSGRVAGLYYAAAEVVGWVGWTILRRDADRLRDHAAALAGTPGDSASAWSFDRWESATGSEASYLRALYSADPEAFFDAIGSDERYAPGWDDAAARRRFGDVRLRSDRRLEGARWTGAALWVNHVVAAFQALQVARLRNLDVDLPGHVDLKARGGWHRGRPGVLLTLERRF